MIRRLLFVILLPLSGHAAEEICPFLNSATAAGVLGGPVTLALTHSTKDKEDVTCEYTRKDSVTYTLRLEVVTLTDIQHEFATYRNQCGPTATPIRAIGNEAVVCALRTKDGQESEQVISRVRDRAFLVRIATNNPFAKRATLREQARNVAEQVAGNLF